MEVIITQIICGIIAAMMWDGIKAIVHLHNR